MASATAAAEQGLRIPADTSFPYRSPLLATLGLLSSRSGDHTKALQYYREAVSEAEANGADVLRFEAWTRYAQELLRSGDLESAETAALQASRLGRLETVNELRSGYLILAQLYRMRRDARTALALINAGLAIPSRSSDHRLWNRDFLYERAMVRLTQGRPADALPDLRLALSYARDWREAIAPSDSLLSGSELYLKDIYAAFIDAATSTNAVAEAFLAVEEERSASLVQMLAERVPGQKPAGSRWPETYREDLARLRALEVTRVVNPTAYDAKAAAQVRQRLSEAEVRAGADFIPTRIEKGENILSLSTLHGVQRSIAPDEALLSLHSGASDSVLWALTGDRLEMYRLGPRDKLANLAERFRSAVGESAPGRDQLGAELYSKLFGSLSAAVLAKRSWVITADDSLFEIPFEALVTKDMGTRSKPLYLVEQHETRRIPSAFMLTGTPPPLPRGLFLGVGDGIYNAADERRKAASDSIKFAGFSSLFGMGGAVLPLELPRLVSSTYELQSSAGAWNSHGGSIFLTGANASREKLVTSLGQKPAVIHIASHVLNGNRDQALIDLGLTPSGAPDVLTTTDVTGLRADGALVVLSGCSSAAAHSVPGAGIMGLTRAWLLAGAQAVVGSRWPVEDDTRDLFNSFYVHLAASSGPARLGSALQQAQLQMLRSDTWRSDPRYWGAFYLLAKE